MLLCVCTSHTFRVVSSKEEVVQCTDCDQKYTYDPAKDDKRLSYCNYYDEEGSE